MAQQWIVQRPSIYGFPAEVDTSVTITEVTEDRVRGTVVWCNENGVSNFDVKRQPNNRFYRGSGSGKISYQFVASE
jgi:hypothetical protein